MEISNSVFYFLANFFVSQQVSRSFCEYWISIQCQIFGILFMCTMCYHSVKVISIFVFCIFFVKSNFMKNSVKSISRKFSWKWSPLHLIFLQRFLVPPIRKSKRQQHDFVHWNLYWICCALYCTYYYLCWIVLCPFKYSDQSRTSWFTYDKCLSSKFGWRFKFDHSWTTLGCGSWFTNYSKTYSWTNLLVT